MIVTYIANNLCISALVHYPSHISACESIMTYSANSWTKLCGFMTLRSHFSKTKNRFLRRRNNYLVIYKKIGS